MLRVVVSLILVCCCLQVSGIVNTQLAACSARPQCTNQGSCCCTDYSGNDAWYPSYRSCPCLASSASSINLEIGDSTTLTCNPGFGCLDTCSWMTPQGSCSYDGTTWRCDASVAGVTLTAGGSSGRDNCDISLVMQAGHAGNWSCQVSTWTDSYAGHVVLGVGSASGLSSSTIWLGIVLPSILGLIVIVLIIVLICCFCPGVCACCCPAGACACCRTNRQDSGYDEIRKNVTIQNPEGPGHATGRQDGHLRQESVTSTSSEEEDRRPRVQIYTSERSPFDYLSQRRPQSVVVNTDLDPQIGYAQVGRRSQYPQYPPSTSQYPPSTSQYPPPPSQYPPPSRPAVIYDSPRLERDQAYMKTARKVSSNIGSNLPDRVRRASGVNVY